MNCPFCQAPHTKVIDSRLLLESNQTRRRRQCVICEERFTTYEKVELTLPRVVKRDLRCVTFSEEKLYAGLLRACEKRPISGAQLEALIAKVIRKMLTSGQREIASAQIGEWVLAELHGLDEVAYIRFASVYRCFQNVDEFKREINRLNDHEA